VTEPEGKAVRIAPIICARAAVMSVDWKTVICNNCYKQLSSLGANRWRLHAGQKPLRR